MAQKQNKGKLLTSVDNNGSENVPAKVKAKLTVTTTTQQVPEDVSTDATTSTLLGSSVKQEEINERKKTNVTFSAASTTFAGKQITRYLQNAVVTEEFNNLGSLTLSPSSTTISGTIEDLGNGKGFKQQVDTVSLFSDAEYVAERRRVLPDLFYVGIADTTVELTSAGTATAPTLSGLQLRVSDHQLDAFNHRTIITTGGTVNNGTSFTGKEWTDKYGGGTLDHVLHKEAANTLSLDVKTVEARSSALGDGTFLVEDKKLSTSAWPILTEDLWDEFALAFIHVTKQVVETGTTSPGFVAGVLTEVRAIDNLHELKIVSSYATPPDNQEDIPVSVDVRTPQWFTSGPTQVDASSGYTADRGTSYDTKNKQGTYEGTMRRTFSSSIPAAPAGTYLNFQPTSSRVATAYENAGDEPYSRILYYDVPDHVDEEPVGYFLYRVQAQFHKVGWVLEVIRVNL